jgi:hypothetical protein
MLVLDANILIRAVLGSRVLFLLRKYAEVEFLAPDTAFQEAREHLRIFWSGAECRSIRQWQPWTPWATWYRRSS